MSEDKDDEEKTQSMTHIPSLAKKRPARAKSFKDWEIEDLSIAFGLRQVKENFKVLDDWLAAKYTPDPATKARLGSISKLLLANAFNWNEEELKMKFIAKLMELVDFEGEGYTTFYDRVLSVDIGDISLNGKVDMVVATGQQKPRKPFFFLNEYKKERNTESDPFGQVMSAMLAAQASNNDQDMPVYGCYLNGRNWFFTVLSGKQFAVSPAFDASQEGILTIYSILMDLKSRIEAYLLIEN